MIAKGGTHQFLILVAAAATFYLAARLCRTIYDAQKDHENDELLQFDYTSFMRISTHRSRFARVLRQSSGIVTLDDVCEALDVSRTDASKIAARWVTQGRLTRIRRGLFAPVPLDSEPESSGVSDPWQLVPELFGNSFVTGWSAAEHWHFTEQLFRRICVKTTESVRRNVVTVRDGEFFVTHVNQNLVFGTRVHWAERVKVFLADPHRAVVDMLDDPRLGGGGQHTADCVAAYLKSKHFKLGTIIEYADRLSNGAVFKRLGFLAEHLLGPDSPLVAECRVRLSSGYANLDPAISSGCIVTRWRLRVPKSMNQNRGS